MGLNDVAVDFCREFSNHTDAFVTIGGNAAVLLLEEQDVEKIRTTKDLDLVVLVDKIDSDFVRDFKAYITKYKYEPHNVLIEGQNEARLYRFTVKGHNPNVIELFSTTPELDGQLISNGKTPLPTEEPGYSLSALLLDENYYNLLQKGKMVIQKEGVDIPILDAQTLVLFKIRAAVDFYSDDKKKKGYKHRNDVITLATFYSEERNDNFDSSTLPQEVLDDYHQFKSIVLEPLRDNGNERHQLLETLHIPYLKKEKDPISVIEAQLDELLDLE